MFFKDHSRPPSQPEASPVQLPSRESLSRETVIAAIRTLRKHSVELSVVAVAAEMGIPSQLLYQDREVLELIYQAALSSDDYHDASLVQGADALIADLLRENKSLKRKSQKLQSELDKSPEQIHKTYAEAFAKGAAMRYGEASDSQSYLDKWARGVLFLDARESLSSDKIKKSYRLLLSILHPDQSSRDTASLMNTLQLAYKFLLERYS